MSQIRYIPIDCGIDTEPWLIKYSIVFLYVLIQPHSHSCVPVSCRSTYVKLCNWGGIWYNQQPGSSDLTKISWVLSGIQVMLRPTVKQEKEYIPYLPYLKQWCDTEIMPTWKPLFWTAPFFCPSHWFTVFATLLLNKHQLDHSSSTSACHIVKTAWPQAVKLASVASAEHLALGPAKSISFRQMRLLWPHLKAIRVILQCWSW